MKNIKIYKVEGMDCASCATLLELDLEDAGIKASCSYAKGELEVEGKHDLNDVKKIVNKSGFEIKKSN